MDRQPQGGCRWHQVSQMDCHARTGLDVNVEESSLSNFQGIVPCGLEGRKVGGINQFLIEKGEEPMTVPDFAK